MKRPRGVAEKNGRYYLRRNKRWIALSRVDEGERALVRALAELAPTDTPRTIGELLLAYRRDGTADLAPTTRRWYERIIDADLHPIFGKMRIDALNASHVAQHLERGKKDGRAVVVNRERAVLSSAFEFGLRQGWVTWNPCRGVRRNRERPRSRYVEHAELRDLIDRAPEHFAHLIAGAYLLGARLSELLALTRDDLRDDGIHVREGKVGKIRVVAWTEARREIIDREIARCDALAARRSRPAPAHVFGNRFGRRWTVWAVESQMARLGRPFHFHDIRAKAASDSKGNLLGHAGGMLAVYVRRSHVA